MSKTLIVLALLAGLSGHCQIVTTTSLLSNGNFWGFTLGNPYDQVVRPYGFVKTNNSGPSFSYYYIMINAAWNGVDYNKHYTSVDTLFGTSLSNFDSLNISFTTKLINWFGGDNSNPPITGSVKYKTNDSIIFNSNQSYSVSFNTTIKNNLSLKCIASTYGQIYLYGLTIKGYSTTTITTGINSIVNSDFDLFVSGNAIKTKTYNEKFQLKVFDTAGKQVFESPLQNVVETDLDEGIYILNVINQNGNLIQSKRVLIYNK